MPYQWVFTYRYFTPPEAGTLAEDFRTRAGTIQGLADDLARVVGELDMAWEGRSQRWFMTELLPAVRDAEQLVSQLEALAGAIAEIRVPETIRRWEWVPDHE